MQKLVILFIVVCLSKYCMAQFIEKVYLWPDSTRGYKSNGCVAETLPSHGDDAERLTEVYCPLLEVFLAGEHLNTGAAVLVVPGGSYRTLSIEKEGWEVAQWLNSIGVNAFVLQYHVPDMKDEALADIQRALRIIRAQAETWRLDLSRVGVLGFSAGAHLCARLQSQYMERTYRACDSIDSLSCLPAFTALIYPAYLDRGAEKTLSPEVLLHDAIPPVFLFGTADDSYANSCLVMAHALHQQGHEVELHFLPKGGHGYGLRKGSPAAEKWPVYFRRWLQGRGVIVASR